MNVIYKPRGRAKEYSPLAVNLYKGCSHGCQYCYAPACLRRSREAFHQNVVPRKHILALLEKDLQALTHGRDSDLFSQKNERHHDRVLFCFTCDPYQGDDSLNLITRQALALFRQYAVPFQVLTKGGMKAARDFDLYSSQDAFACTLTFDDAARTGEWEPYAALPESRIHALREAKTRGIETWVSFEPVLDEQAVYSLFSQTYDVVDLYKVGKCSGDFSQVSDWARFGETIIQKLEQKKKAYYIKDDLRRCLM